MEACTYNPCTWEAEAEGSLQVPSQQGWKEAKQTNKNTSKQQKPRETKCFIFPLKAKVEQTQHSQGPALVSWISSLWPQVSSATALALANSLQVFKLHQTCSDCSFLCMAPNPPQCQLVGLAALLGTSGSISSAQTPPVSCG